MLIVRRCCLLCQRWRLPLPSARLLHVQPDRTTPFEPAVISDVDMRRQICMAFRDTLKEWARSVPPEFISRPSSFQNLQNQKKQGYEISGESEEEEEAEEEDDEGITSDEEEEDEHDQGITSDEEEDDDSEKDDNVVSDRDGVECEEQEKVEQEKLEGMEEEYDNSHSYYLTDSGKIKYKHLQILAPKDEIYQKLSEAGLISPKFKRPLPVLKLITKPDSVIVGWFYYCSIELLQYFRICHNLNEVKAIVEYHLRWSAIRTLAKKYKCTERDIVRKFGRDLECEDKKKGTKVRLMSKQEIKQVSRGVNKRVQITHRFRALRILAEME